MEKRDLAKRLTELLTETQSSDRFSVTENADMSKYTSFRAGGKALALVEVENTDQLKAVLRFADEEKITHLMLGNGSNTLFKDSGYDGLAIKLGEGFGEVHADNPSRWFNDGDEYVVRCGASILMSSLAKMLQLNSLTGFEFASGIPGSLGGAVFMNAGAYGGEMKDIVKSVRAVSPDGLTEKAFTNEELEFRYRGSALQQNDYIVTEVTLSLKKGDREEIAAQMKELNAKRNAKQPVNYPSAGSTFKRPEGYFAGKLIEDAGLKGLTVGGAQVSTLHSGFVINRGGATATDILQLIALVQNTVYDKFGVMLEPEVRIIG
ncbi:MAG: UDP-N-acetylmuramate dehydrogenase [Anaerovoracaceae bacterium]